MESLLPGRRRVWLVWRTVLVSRIRRVSPSRVVFAAATGIGSWPGTSAREAAEVVVGELHTLTHLVELPARGVGADLIGRAGALLVDIAIDTVPRGYRIAAGRSAVTRRAVSLLDEDIDALEEAWEKAGLRGGGADRQGAGAGPDHARRAAGTGQRPPGDHRSRSACATWRGRWPKAWRRTARRSPAGWNVRSSCSSTSRRCPLRWRAG